MVQSVLHLIHPIYFQFSPFHHFPFSETPPSLTCITVQFHCTPQCYVLRFTCIFSSCCLQFASVLQTGIVFQAINWLLFIYIPNKMDRPLLAVSVIQHTHSQQPTIRSYCVLCARQTIINSLLRHYGLTLYYLLQCWFSIRKRTGFAGNV